MKRIAIFVDAFFPMIDGVIACVDNYAKRLNDDGFETIVFAPRNRDKKYQDNFSYRVQRCKSVKVFFLDYDLPLPALDKQFKRAIKGMKIDLIHVHSPFTVGSYAIKYARKHGIPSIATFHSQFKQDFKRALKFDFLANLMLKRIVRVYNNASLCLTMNDFARNLLKEYGCKNRIELLPNGTDMRATDDKKTLSSIADKKWGLGKCKFVMLFVGRINILKNLDFILDSLALLPKGLDFKMIFAGDGQDREHLEKRVQTLGLQDKVIFTGKILDRQVLQTLYARADLFLIPSEYDTDAIVKIEAACFETASVALENTGAGASITDGKNGFLIKKDEKSFADLLQKLYDSPELVRKVGRQAKQDLYITWDDVVKRLEGIYLKVIKDFGVKK